MIIEINITDKKTENALKAASCIIETPMSDLVIKRTEIYLIHLAETIKKDTEMDLFIKNKHPEAHKLLMEVL